MFWLIAEKFFSTSIVSVESNGIVDIDFGYNFNTIVNTNEFGQGSLEQFILNSNTLGEVGLDIEANAIFDPAAEEDVSIFMIPPTGDSFGRTADVNYNAAGYFDILLDNANTFSVITGTNTIIDGRTQTAYSGDSNAGTVGSGGAGVGIANTALPNYTRPEIQIHRNGGDVLRLNGSNVTIRDISLYANNNAGVRVQGGSATISNTSGYILINSSLVSPAGITYVLCLGILCNTRKSSISFKVSAVPSQTGL